MSYKEQYEVWFDLKITHDYYSNSHVPLTFTPTDETRILLLKNRLFLKNIASNHWVILRITGEVTETENKELAFEIRSTDNDFYYVTGKEEQKDELPYTLEDPQYPGIWKIMKIKPEKGETGMANQILHIIPSVEKYFEFICIPKFHSGDISLRMTEDKNRFQIEEPEIISMPDKTNAIRFVSKDKIPLKKIYKYKVRLWEIRESGERLISDSIPCPSPSNISVFHSNDTITSYYYF